MEQQQHLVNLNQQREELISELNQLQSQISEKRDLLLRVSGAIDYLTQTGVTLPEPTGEVNSENIESESTEQAVDVEEG